MRSLRLLAASLLLLAFVSAASATTVVQLAPGQADALARRIVEATVVAAREVPVDGMTMTAVEYDLAVSLVVKDDGSVGPQLASNAGILRIRQLGSLDPSNDSGRIVGMPRYEQGARYRLALNGESARGLTSPVGFGQGVQLLAAPPKSAGAAP